MTDGDNKEASQPEQPERKPYRNPFDRPPVPPRIVEPDPNYSPDEKGQARTPEEIREELYREAAKKIAAEGVELFKLGTRYYKAITHAYYEDHVEGEELDKDGIHVEDRGVRPGENIEIALREEYPPYHPVELRPMEDYKPGRDSHIGLEFDGVPTPETVAQYNRAIEENPESKLGFGVEYSFDEEGRNLKEGWAPGKKSARRFLSEMQPEDFEQVRTALASMRQRLTLGIEKWGKEGRSKPTRKH